MALARTHKGWENEHLATFLMSRIAFVASPLKVADDVGTDLICTLYTAVHSRGVRTLVPRSSVALQVKSSTEPWDVAPRLQYLAHLEMPYYVGVADQGGLSLEVFSARFLPLLLSLRGVDRHQKLPFVPVEQLQGSYREGDDTAGYRLLCPRVAVLRADDSREAAAAAGALIQRDAAEARKAIASRVACEYIFDRPDGSLEIFTGPDSAKTFRGNFFSRLAEALHNLAWLLESGQSVELVEVDAYLSIASTLVQATTVPSFVDQARQRLAAARNAAA